MIYQVGKKQCLNSGQKWIDINPLESDLIVQPTPLLEFPGPNGHYVRYVTYSLVEFSVQNG